MKINLFILSSLVGAGAVLIKEHHKTIRTKAAKTQQNIQTAQNNISNIKNNIAIIQLEKENLTEMSQDLAYKWRVFNTEVQAHLAEIKSINKRNKNN